VWAHSGAILSFYSCYRLVHNGLSITKIGAEG